jgi:hypothetical protein
MAVAGAVHVTRDKTRKPGKPPLPVATVRRVVDLAVVRVHYERAAPKRHFGRSYQRIALRWPGKVTKIHNSYGLRADVRPPREQMCDPLGSFTPKTRRDRVAAVIRRRGCRQPEERNMHANLRRVLVAAAMMCAARSASANVITDRDKKAIAAVVIDAAIDPA